MFSDLMVWSKLIGSALVVKELNISGYLYGMWKIQYMSSQALQWEIA